MDNYWKGCPPKMNDARFLTDYRQADVREVNRKRQIGIEDDHVLREYYQSNGEKFMDNEFNLLMRTNRCFTNSCIHTNPTRSNPELDYREMDLYNKVRMNKIKMGNPQFPTCKNLPNYRLTNTAGARY